MAKLYVTCGIAGSGKTKVMLNLIDTDEEDTLVSMDEIRSTVYKDRKDQSHNKEVFDLAMAKIEMFGAMGMTTYYDATNIKSKGRKELIARFRKYFDEIICLWVSTPVEKCKIQDARRKPWGDVGEAVIDRMASQFEEPTLDEGWDNIIKIENTYKI